MKTSAGGSGTARRELEITDLNRLYLEREQLGVQIMGMGMGSNCWGCWERVHIG